jgi:hypothetical protein
MIANRSALQLHTFSLTSEGQSVQVTAWLPFKAQPNLFPRVNTHCTTLSRSLPAISILKAGRRTYLREPNKLY